MKQRILTTAIALMALTITFNSCDKKDDPAPEPEKKGFVFPYEDVELAETDNMVFTSKEEIDDFEFFKNNSDDLSIRVYVGKYPEPDSLHYYNVMEPNTKYYWCLQAERETYGNTYTSEKSEVRSFYYVAAPEISVHNVEGDWAAVVTWKHNDLLKDATITLAPDKDCEYDKTPITVSATQDSCYISAGSEFSKKYTVYHQWWDDSKAQYYEPVVYSFTATFSGEVEGTPFTVTAAPVNYIFLDRATYAADKQFNVYRMGQIGNRTWLLEDLRGETGSSVMLTSPLGFKACAYSYKEYKNNSIIPEGFHLASDDDWQDLEYTYGVDKTDCNNYNLWEEWLGDKALIWGWSTGSDSLFKEYTKDTIDYVGGHKDLFYMLRSDMEWERKDSINELLGGKGVFNIRPYGLWDSSFKDVQRKNIVEVYLTSTTKDINGSVDDDQFVVRFFWSGNSGVARIWVDMNKNGNYNIYYTYRCVKDKK